MSINHSDPSQSPDAAAETPDERGPRASFPIVGVGASAGGLEAFTQLLGALPLDTGMGFVLVQHLDPAHESALTQILSRATSLPVREVTNDLAVQANHVYVIPPDMTLSIAEGVLKLQPRPRTRTPHRPIDAFFESLAQDQRDRAIGVVLSGTASDGTLGLEAIKAEGGITFAQDDSAKHDSMPRSAVAAGCVDLVLSPADIAKELARIAKHPYVAGQPLLSTAEDDGASATAYEDDPKPLASDGRGTPRSGAKPVRAEAKRGRGEGAESKAAKDAADAYKRILLLLRNHSGVDFSLYKSTTIQRRITRRLVLNKQNTLEDYAQFLRGNAKELDALYSDVLISVTSFFRNPEMFDALQREVLPKLLQQRGDDPLRCWVLGCSTGQEAYSIAMAFVEAAEQAPRMRKLQLFATDLNEALLDKARHGLYAKSLADDVTPERLRRFFVEEEGGYRVSKMLREMVVFARQNLIADPPFSRMDLISCRNLLIYLEPTLQKKALPTFHYALKPEGFLLLGASESVGGFTDLFEPVDKKHKIYSKKPAPTPAFHLPVRTEHGAQPPASRRPPLLMRRPEGPEPPEGLRGELNSQREADRITVNQFAPPGVLVNAELQVLQFRGPTGAYLEPPAGKASFDVLKMAREGLMLPLRAAIDQARKENKTARRDNVRVKRNGKTRTVNLEVIPLKNLRERCFLILFQEAAKAGRGGGRAAAAEAVEPPGPTAPLTAKQESNRSAELETELAETREYLQAMQEQHEAANEELQAANEEVQSANEELQSINEELETSKEELESANEELTTVNDEMSNRNAELNRLNDDLVNLQTSAKLAIVLLGRDLTIRRFSPQAAKQFELLATDVGQPISHVRHNLVSADAAQSPLDLAGLGAEVIAGVCEQELEVQDKAGRWHSLRVRPYMTLDNKVDGAVLVLVDVDTLKRSEQAVAAARDYAQNTFETLREPLLVLDKDLRVVSANRSFYKAFRLDKEQTEGHFVYDLGNGQWNIPRLCEFLEEVLPHNQAFDDFEVEHDFLGGGGKKTMLLNARRIRKLGSDSELILLAIEDITKRRAAERALKASELRYRRLFQTAKDGILILDAHTGKVTDANDFMSGLVGLKKDELLGKELYEIGMFKDIQENREAFRELQHTGYLRHEHLTMRNRRGETVEVELIGNVYHEDHELVAQCNVRNISERSGMERQIAQQAEALAGESRRKDEFLAMLGHELRNPLAAISNAVHLLGLQRESESLIQQQARSIIERQMGQLQHLVDDLLEVSRITTGRVQLRLERVAVSGIVDVAVETVRPLIEQRRHGLTVSLPPEPIWLHADAARLEQVVANLLTNAAKYTDAGGHVWLSVQQEGDECVLQVRDTGAGIAPELLPRIFDLFTQADRSLDRSQGGLGIGLALVQRLTELHGGSVEVYSALGQGSEFVVRLPVLPTPRKTSDVSETSEVSGVPAAMQPDEPRRAGRVLMVDDSVDFVESMAIMLRLSGYDVRTAHTGPAAVQAAIAFEPAVVLLDIGLPEMNGYEVARQLRERPELKNVQVVALTGYGQESDLRRAQAAGFNLHLVKPVGFQKLQDLLTTLLAPPARSLGT